MNEEEMSDSGSKVPWYETEDGKRSLLDRINAKYWFKSDGTAVPKDEFCEKCKNESVACVCM